LLVHIVEPAAKSFRSKTTVYVIEYTVDKGEAVERAWPAARTRAAGRGVWRFWSCWSCWSCWLCRSGTMFGFVSFRSGQ